MQKTVPNHTRIEIQYVWLYVYAHPLPRYTKHIYIAIDAQVYFHRWLFANPAPQGCTTRSVEPLRGFNKGACGTKLLPTTILAYPVDCVCFCRLLNTHVTLATACVLMEGITHLQLPNLPHHPSDPLPPTYPLIYATCDITAIVKKLLKIQHC